MMSALFILAFLSCSSTPVTLAQNCDVRLSSVSPTSVSDGDTVRGVGGPMTSIWDTAVYVDGTRAELVSLQRDGCEACDECKQENSCTACDDCDECDAQCDSECVESVDFLAPSVDGTSANVSFYNGHGQSNPISIMYTSGTDTADPEDSGGTDAPIDTASPEDTSSSR